LDPIVQGLEISVTGLAVTFSALGIFILVMLVLKRVFREKPENGDEQVIEVAETPGETASIVTEDDSEVAAVIATAITYLRAKTMSSLGTSLETGKGSWWVSNRLNAKQGTGINIKRSA
jgi:sodium pump decarboxylase gamma subunit